MASGNPLFELGPLSAEPPSANVATVGSILTVSADADEKVTPVLKFDPGSTIEHADFAIVMPPWYDGGGVTLTIFWTTDLASPTTESVKWDAIFKSFTADVDDLEIKAFGAAPAGNTVTSDAPAAGGRIIEATLTVADGSDLDNIAKDEYAHMRIERDSADGGDDLNSNDAMLVKIYAKET